MIEATNLTKRYGAKTAVDGQRFLSVHPAPDGLSAGTGVAVPVAWVALALAGAALLVTRRDA